MTKISMLFAALTLLSAAPASAQGEILITQAKAMHGGVTPGDTPGYPITITVQGAYVLAGNLSVSPNRDGIWINANNVDLDMNGFVLNGGTNAHIGISSNTVLYGTRIHDGVVQWFKGDGIFLDEITTYWEIKNMRIIGNGGGGINAINTAFLRVLDSLIVTNMGGAGITCGSTCDIERNTISLNQGAGVFLRSGMVLGNSISLNKGVGIDTDNPDYTGFANNSVVSNNGNNNELGPQVVDGVPAMNPNACFPAPC